MQPSTSPLHPLPAELTVGQSASLRSCLLNALAGGQPLALDGSCVAAVDTIGIQVLAAARQSAAAAGIEWRISAPSAALREHARAGGLERALGL